MNKKIERALKKAKAMTVEQRALFIRKLAEFLVNGQAKKSIELEMGLESAKEWAALRRATPLYGYPTIEEAEETLRQFLS